MSLVDKLWRLVRREYLRAVSNMVFVGIFSVPRYTQQHPEEQPLVEPYEVERPAPGSAETTDQQARPGELP